MARRLRVMQVINSFARGGAEVFAGTLATTLTTLGIDVGVCAVGSIGAEAERPVRNALHSGDVDTFSLTEIGSRSVVARASSLLRLLNSWQADIVHVHTLSPTALAFIGTRAVGVHSFHAGTVASPNRWIKRGTEAIVCRLVRRTVSVSHALRPVVARRAGVSESRIVVIPNGIDVLRFRKAAADRVLISRIIGRELEDGECVAVSVARVDANKAHDVIIDAAAELASRGLRLHVVIAGRSDVESDWTNSLKLRARLAKVEDRLHWAGVIENVPGLMKAADIVVTASRSEALGLTAIEALAAGTPLIASDIPAHREVTENGKYATLFARDDSASLATAIERAMIQPRIDALDHVERQYSIRVCAERHASLYRDLVSAR